MFKKIFDRHKLEITLICSGDTGKEIGAKMIESLKEHGAIVKSMAITSELETHHSSEGFDLKVSIDDTHDGFAKQLDLGIAAANEHRDSIDEAIQKILPEDKDGLLLLVTGAGATGLGATMVAAELLFSKYRKLPPIVTLLPESFESSRVQYNISQFLYNIAFRRDNRGNAVLLLDNKPSFKEMELPFSTVTRTRLDTIPVAFADLLFASFEKAMTEEFDATVKDLFDVIHTPGIAVFVSEDLASDESEVDSSRISDVISESVISTTSLSTEQVFDAKNAFIAMFNIDTETEQLSFQTEFEAKKLKRSFSGNPPFIKIVVPDKRNHGSTPKLRGIVAGLPLPNRILQIMRMAREARKRIIIKEHAMMKEVIPFDIDYVNSLEDKLRS
ncbi:MAG: hypothetical protein ACXAE3_07775 [Candidatus Kariarchaeaceae archaeon]|jgi:hypothetical protein